MTFQKDGGHKVHNKTQDPIFASRKGMVIEKSGGQCIHLSTLYG